MFIKSISTTFLLVFSLLNLVSCASIQSGTTQEITVNSVPQGAAVYVAVRSKEEILNKRLVGVTPLKVLISRKDGVILLEMDAYKPVEVPLTHKTNPWFWGNVVLGSLLSSSIDTSTGAINEYDPNEYLVELESVESQEM